MNERIEAILELPPQHRVAVLIGTLLAIATAYWFLFYSSVAEEYTTLKEAIEGPNGLHVQIAQQRGIAAHLDEYRAEVQTLDVELKKALAQLPDAKEIPNLLAKISDTAQDSGLEVRLFKPQSESKQDFYASVPVEIEVAGDYHQVATFFDEVARLDRIVNLDGLSMVDPQVDDDTVVLKTNVVATAFRFLDESERPQEGGGKDGELKSKRRGAEKKTGGVSARKPK